MHLQTILLPLGSWAVAFVLVWLAGRRLTRLAHGRPGHLALVAAVVAVSSIVPIVAFTVFSMEPLLGVAAVALSLLSLILQIRLVLPVQRFGGDRGQLPECTDPAVVASVGDIARRLGILPPRVFQWTSMTGSLVALAFTFGLQAPSIVVTDGILHRLTIPERDAILAHEIAHLARGSLRVIAALTPLAALVGLALSLVAPIWVSLAGMLATYVGLRTLVGRRDEIACDVLAGGVLDYRTIAAALDKIHVAHAIPGNTRLSTLAHAIATHPHRATRLAALRSAAAEADRALIPDESESAKRHRKAALVARLYQGIAYFAAIATAHTHPALATALFLTLTILPASLIIAASWSKTRHARRLSRFPPIAGTAWIAVGLGLVLAPALIPLLSAGLARVASGALLIGLLFLFTGMIRAHPVRRRRREIAGAFQSGDFAGARNAAVKNPPRARRDPVVRHTAAFAAAILGDRQVAIDEFIAIHREHPKAFGSAIAAAAVLMNSDPARALDLAETVSRALPEDPTAHLSAARALRRLGRVSEARDRIMRGRATEPDDGRLAALEACLALDQGEIDRARSLSAEAERLAPGDAWPTLARAEIATRTEPADRAAAAVAAAETSVRAHPVALLADEVALLKSRLC